jgi:hypothetical protein
MLSACVGPVEAPPAQPGGVQVAGPRLDQLALHDAQRPGGAAVVVQLDVLAGRPTLEPDLRPLVDGQRLDPPVGGVAPDETAPDLRLLGPALGHGGEPLQGRRTGAARQERHIGTPSVSEERPG